MQLKSPKVASFRHGWIQVFEHYWEELDWFSFLFFFVELSLRQAFLSK